MSHRPRWYRRLSAAGVCALAAALLALAGCSPGPSNASEAGSESTQETTTKSMPVETSTVSTAEFKQTFEVPGITEASAQVRVAFESAGRITRLTVDEGDEVRRGQLLARVETDIDQARIDLLENQVETAQKEYDRAKSLVEEGIGTTQQLDQAESALENAKLNLKQAKVSLRRGKIYSPVSGEVARKHAEVGEFASPGVPLVDIIDGRALEVKASIPASKASVLSKGDEATIEMPAVGRDYTGRVVRIPASVNRKTRTLEVTVRLEAEAEEGERPLRPGMRATARFVQKVWPEAVLIPRTAVLQGYERDEVAVFEPADEGPGTASIRPVELGPGAGNRVVVLEGLKPGDRLITRGHRGLTDGARVRAVQTSSPTAQSD